MFGYLGRRGSNSPGGGGGGLATLPDPLLIGNGTGANPALAFVSDPDTGLYRTAANTLALRAGGNISLILDGNPTPAGPRSYIVDAANAKAVMTLTRGDAASPVTPDSSYSMAFSSSSFQVGGGEAIKGYVAASAPQTAAGLMLGLSGVAEIPSAGTWTPPGGAQVHGMVGVFGQATGYKASSRLWGGNVIAIQAAAAASALTGLEIGVEARAGASVQDRIGAQIVTLAAGVASGSGEDIGLKFADKTSPTQINNLWQDCVISIGSPGTLNTTVGWPLAASGTIMYAYGRNDAVTVQAVNGIDFSTVAFSGASLRMPGFLARGNGRVSINTTTTTDEAPLYIDAVGEAYPLRIDGASIVNTVGAPGAANPLVTPAGYLAVKFGASVFKIALFN